MFLKHVYADPETVCSRTPEAERLRQLDRVRLEKTYTAARAASEQRVFEGRLTDWRRACERAGCEA